MTSYHGVEYPEEDDTSVQFLDGGHQSHDEEEEKEGREKQKDNVVDPNTVCVVSRVGGEWRDVFMKRECLNMAECIHTVEINKSD